MTFKTSLQEAAAYFVHDVLSENIEEVASTTRKRAYAASIEANGDGQRQKWIVSAFIAKPSLKKMALTFLNDPEADNETLSDLIKEIANIIVGRTKVIAAEKGLGFDISTPSFVGVAKPIPSDSDFQLHFKFGSDIWTIAVKKAAQ
ncbi:hypothetical protein AGMMS50229_05730 [Campylobacterota bacterium]|nr:hypothetical protein AGMMS50229_05730 [Campylobacterota bacterium]